ncbi:MAG: hypothetical protein K6T78_03480 [Alicyclobacillus sp.]|nr:hypothetical protein [Alicyclobacillus sp.]
MNIGMLFKWGSILMGMAQDPNIHMICRGAWAGIRRLRGAAPPRPAGAQPQAAAPGRSVPNARSGASAADVPGWGPAPSEADMKRMFEEMGLQPPGGDFSRGSGWPNQQDGRTQRGRTFARGAGSGKPGPERGQGPGPGPRRGPGPARGPLPNVGRARALQPAGRPQNPMGSFPFPWMQASLERAVPPQRGPRSKGP